MTIAYNYRYHVQAAEYVKLGKGNLVGFLTFQPVKACNGIKRTDTARTAGGSSVLTAGFSESLHPCLRHCPLGNKWTGTDAG